MHDGIDKTAKKKRVLLIDDHPMVVIGCRHLLNGIAAADISVAPTPSEGFRLYRREQPDVIIIDLSLREQPFSGLSLLRRLRQHDKHVPIIILSMHADPAVARHALMLGANAFVAKDASATEFVSAFESVQAGNTYVSTEVATGLSFEDDRTSTFTPLTLRELEVLSLIVAGKTHQQIAREINLSYKSVQNTVVGLKRKLGAETIPELLAIGAGAIERSLRKDRDF